MGVLFENEGSLRVTDDAYMTPEAVALVERAEALVPRLAERAQAAEQAGRVPDETVRELAEAGLFRVLQPRRWGGYEQDPRVFYRIQMTLARGCMSTAWIYGVIGVHNWQLPLFPEQAQHDVWGEKGERSGVLIASTYMPVGQAEPVEGGYRLSGHWGFSSGVDHCQWLLLGGLLPRQDGGEGLEHTTFLVPREDVEVVANWDVHGLRATGSHDVVVKGAFVPSHRTQRTNNHDDAGCPGRELNAGWLYRIPFTQVFQRAVSTSCIGALDGAIETFRRRAAAHVGKHGAKTAEDPNAQLAVAEAMLRSDELKLVLMRNFQQIVDHARDGSQMGVEDRLLQRAQSARVAKTCASLVDELLRACAASGLYRSNPIERIVRDVHQARGHIANNSDAYGRAFGAVMLGLPNADPYI